jgi:hypothetical protein
MIPNLIFLPISLNELRGFQKNGGNAIGFDEGDGPLLSTYIFCSIPTQGEMILTAQLSIVLLVQFNYCSTAVNTKRDDALVDEAKSRLAAQVKALSVEAGLDHPFHYMNYAGGDEDVFAGYAEGRREWLRKVKESVVGNGRWDVGGWKI